MNLLNKEIKKLPGYPFDRLRSLLANTNTANNKVIDIPSLNNGIYLLELVNNDGSSFIKKFVYTFE